MSPEQIDRVFGRGRLKMVTGEHVEVYREAVAPGERRRYTKRFLKTADGDFGQWTEREWRILARLIGHGIRCVPDVVQFDRGGAAGMPLVQTYDAGVTVDQWATLLPLTRDGRVYRHVFEDCAHWWALAHHCLVALNEIHQLHLVHLDIKGDNVCIPFGPATFDPDGPEPRLYPIFGELALIDFAFALVSRERVTTPLPIGWQKDYDYQSPRLLRALEDGRNDDLRRTRELDWRCDIYSLVAMLKRYLPDEGAVHQPERAAGWSGERYEAAKSLLLTLREWHDRDAPQIRPHEELIAATGERLRDGELARSLASGWTLAKDTHITPAGASPLTPMTRLAPPIRVFVSPRAAMSAHHRAAPAAPDEAGVPLLMSRRADAPGQTLRAGRRSAALASAAMVAIGVAAMPLLFPDATRTLLESARTFVEAPRTDGGPPAVGRQVAAAPHSAITPPAEETVAAPAEVADAAPAQAVTAATTQAVTAAATQAAATAPSPAAEAAPTPAPQDASPVAEESAGQVAQAAPGVSVESPSATTVVPLAPVSESATTPSRTKSRAAPAGDAQRDKRAAATTPPPTVGRSAKPQGRSPAPAAKSAAPVIASRSGPAPGLPATSGSRTAVAAAQPPNPVSRGETPSAPVQVALASPSERSALPVSPSSPEQPVPTMVAPPVSAPVTSSPPTPDVGVPASPTTGAPVEAKSGAPAHDATATRSKKSASGSEKRGEVGLLTWLFQRAQRTLAPIEERRPQGSGRREPAPGAPQTPSPPQDAIAQAPTVSAAPRAQSQAVPPALPPAEPRAAPPRPVPESTAAAGALASDRTRETELASRGRRALVQAIPRSAARAQTEISRVLWTAANAYDPVQERAVSDAAQAIWAREDATSRASPADGAEARRLNDEAIRAYWYRRNVTEAFDLQMKAFGANPYDPEVAGNLAFLHLRVNPAQPEMARQLALHAIAVRGAQYPAGRLEDWNTYAVASALTGRDADARNALFVTVALAKNVERNCKAGQIAIASYGERVMEPVNAMMYRIHTQGRSYTSPHCQWPMNWSASARLQ